MVDFDTLLPAFRRVAEGNSEVGQRLSWHIREWRPAKSSYRIRQVAAGALQMALQTYFKRSSRAQPGGIHDRLTDRIGAGIRFSRRPNMLCTRAVATLAVDTF